MAFVPRAQRARPQDCCSSCTRGRTVPRLFPRRPAARAAPCERLDRPTRGRPALKLRAGPKRLRRAAPQRRAAKRRRAPRPGVCGAGGGPRRPPPPIPPRRAQPERASATHPPAPATPPRARQRSHTRWPQGNGDGPPFPSTLPACPHACTHAQLSCLHCPPAARLCASGGLLVHNTHPFGSLLTPSARTTDRKTPARKVCADGPGRISSPGVAVYRFGLGKGIPDHETWGQSGSASQVTRLTHAEFCRARSSVWGAAGIGQAVQEWAYVYLSKSVCHVVAGQSLGCCRVGVYARPARCCFHVWLWAGEAASQPSEAANPLNARAKRPHANKRQRPCAFEVARAAEGGCRKPSSGDCAYLLMSCLHASCSQHWACTCGRWIPESISRELGTLLRGVGVHSAAHASGRPAASKDTPG